MTSPRTILWVERLAWISLYVGLFALVIGYVTQRQAQATGVAMMVLGSAAAVAGVLLILLRSRMREPAPPTSAPHKKGTP
jgi:O-antigen/teichoic acid export membrane protein